MWKEKEEEQKKEVAEMEKQLRQNKEFAETIKEHRIQTHRENENLQNRVNLMQK
jgi:hypothetical protein